MWFGALLVVNETSPETSRTCHSQFRWHSHQLISKNCITLGNEGFKKGRVCESHWLQMQHHILDTCAGGSHSDCGCTRSKTHGNIWLGRCLFFLCYNTDSSASPNARHRRCRECNVLTSQLYLVRSYFFEQNLIRRGCPLP